MQEGEYSVTARDQPLFPTPRYNFYKANTLDPGFIAPGTMVNAKKTICKLCDDGEFDKINFCYSCCIRKPFRSKHDSFSQRCVAKFDHYCPFTGNAIGANNHKYARLICVCAVELRVVHVPLPTHRYVCLFYWTGAGS